MKPASQLSRAPNADTPTERAPDRKLCRACPPVECARPYLRSGAGWSGDSGDVTRSNLVRAAVVRCARFWRKLRLFCEERALLFLRMKSQQRLFTWTTSSGANLTRFCSSAASFAVCAAGGAQFGPRETHISVFSDFSNFQNEFTVQNWRIVAGRACFWKICVRLYKRSGMYAGRKRRKPVQRAWVTSVFILWLSSNRLNPPQERESAPGISSMCCFLCEKQILCEYFVSFGGLSAFRAQRSGWTGRFLGKFGCFRVSEARSGLKLQRCFLSFPLKTCSFRLKTTKQTVQQLKLLKIMLPCSRAPYRDPPGGCCAIFCLDAPQRISRPVRFFFICCFGSLCKITHFFVI